MLTGYRYWFVDRDTARLAGAWSVPWDTDESRARCLRGRAWRWAHFPPTHDDVPGVDCDCGIYSFLDPWRLPLAKPLGIYPSPFAYGLVAVGGRVIPHARGYRSSYARILCLYDTTSYARQAAARYNVPLRSKEELWAESPSANR